MRGNVVKVTIGDYIYRMPGFLENVNVTIDNSNTPWEILLNEHSEDDVRQLPHMVSVQCSFKPILNILPRKESYLSPYVPLIVNTDDYLQVKPKYRPELDKVQPGASGVTIKPFGGFGPPLAPPPVTQLPPPTNQNTKTINHKKPKKGKPKQKSTGRVEFIPKGAGSGPSYQTINGPAGGGAPNGGGRVPNRIPGRQY